VRRPARRRSERRIKAANFPREKSLRTFDFEANPNIDPATIHTLASCEWIKKGQPLCLIGDSGTGKSHMFIALGTEAAMKGYRVRYTLATKLVNELVEAADEKQLNKTIARYGRVDLLCIDELGYMELDRHGAELLFQVLTEREEKNSIAIASNESFGGWTKTFTAPGSARPSSTDSPSTAPSSQPAPTPTASPAPGLAPRNPPRSADWCGYQPRRPRHPPGGGAVGRASPLLGDQSEVLGEGLKELPPRGIGLCLSHPSKDVKQIAPLIARQVLEHRSHTLQGFDRVIEIHLFIVRAVDEPSHVDQGLRQGMRQR
jgi:hypothetical protein